MEDNELRDEFFSEEDLDIANMSDEELDAYWNLWFEQAQATNDIDKNYYSHGVFAGAAFGVTGLGVGDFT